MQIVYEILYNKNQTPNALSDLLAFNDMAVKESFLLFSIEHNVLHLLLTSEDVASYFLPILEVYESKRLDSVPSFERATLIAGNEKLLLNRK